MKTPTELETYSTEIIIDKQPNRLIGVVYRHPSKRNEEKCIEVLNETLTKICKENKKVLIAGDSILIFSNMSPTPTSMIFYR